VRRLSATLRDAGRVTLPEQAPSVTAPDRPGAGHSALLLPYDRAGSVRTVRLVRNWGRIGTKGQELVEIHADEIAPGQALEALARAKRKRGYRDL
jgi:hypothetical protein